MPTQFVLVKSHKSVGMAIFLTLAFGPIGLFYSSITGGIVMTIIPLSIYIFFWVSVFKFDLFLMLGSLTLLLIFLAISWIICSVWAAIAVLDYNSELDKEVDQQDLLNRLSSNQQTSVSLPINDKPTDPNRPSLQDWLKDNPGKSLNDYFAKFR